MDEPKSRSRTWIEGIAALMLFISMGVVAVAAQNQAAQQSGDQKAAVEWLKFSPQGAPFSLSLPAAPGEKAKDEKTGIRAHNYRLQSGPAEYQIVWLANVPDSILQRGPLNVLFPRGLEEILKSARQAGKKDMVTTHEEDITLSGYRGREATMESGSDRIEAKCFIAGHDFITLAVLHPKEESSSADAKRFLESLSLPDLRLAASPNGNAAAGGRTGAGPDTDVDTRPIPLNRPRPNYTDQARNNGVQGVIRLRLLVGPDGSVRDVRFVSHLPDGLDQAALDAARQMRFKAATKGGQPVATWVTVEVEFRLGRDRL